MPQPHNEERRWTAAETAEDLLAQVEDALVAGWSEEELLAAFDREGVDLTTAGLLIDDVRKDAAASGGPSGSGHHEDVAIAVSATRAFLRRPDDALTIDPERQRDLHAALCAAGLRPTTADALLADVVGLERRMAAVYHRRMRRLGVQGMAVGGLCTALFVFGGLFGGDGARWHLFTATLTGGLFAYSMVLWRRGRPPTR